MKVSNNFNLFWDQRRNHLNVEDWNLQLTDTKLAQNRFLSIDISLLPNLIYTHQTIHLPKQWYALIYDQFHQWDR